MFRQDDDDDDDNYPGKLLHQAALYLNVDLLKDLLTGDEIKNIDALDRFGCTPLHTACLSAAEATTQNDSKVLDSSLEFIMALIDHGADLNIQAGERYDLKTPLHIIAEVGNEKILTLLLSHKADLMIRDKRGYTPLLIAQIHRQVDCTEIIQNEIELRQQVQQEPEKKLLDACFDGDLIKAEECLAQLGAQAKAVLNSSPNGSDTLNFLYRACRTGNVDLVRLLLKHGAIAKPHRETSYSPLYIACRIGNLEIVQMLLTHFPHLVAIATLEQILPFAAACAQGHLPIVELLLNYKHYPCSSCHIFTDRLQRSYIFPFNLNAVDINEQTCLYHAVIGGHVDVVDCLLSFRVSLLNAQDIEAFKRRTLPSSEKGSSRLSSDQFQTLDDFVSTLIENNRPTFCPFNLDIYANTGRTALHEAIEQENFKLVHLLVSNGVNVNLTYEHVTSRSNNDEQCFVTRATPLSSACRLGNVQLIEYLLNALATDKELLAYNACRSSHLIGHLLKYRALPDKEFKLNRRQFTNQNLYTFDEQFWSKIDLTKIWNVQNDEKKDDNNNTISESSYSMEPLLKRRSSKRYQILNTSFEQFRTRFSTRTPLVAHSVIPSNCPVPGTPVGIQWHQYGPLKYLDPLWLLQASIFVNKDVFAQPSDLTNVNRHLLLHCITRIDLSDNLLENLPTCLFQMHSLRILNVSNNQLGDLSNDPNIWHCHQLIELDLSHNALTTLPSAIFQLRSLQRVYAAHNQIHNLPVELWSAPMLTDLNLAHNSLKALPEPVVAPPKSGRHMTSRHSANSNRTPSEYRSNTMTNPSTLPSSMTTTNFSVLLPPTVPTRSTTMTQISNENHPASPDDEEEIERRSRLKLTYSTSPTSAPSFIPVERLCLWQKHIAQTTDEDLTNSNDKSSPTSTVSRLNSLNLSHNGFTKIPTMLCCLTPHLTSLNLSHNLIDDSSSINFYPTRLKTLDLSSNNLEQSIYVETSRKHRQNANVTCFRPELKETPSTVDPMKRRRSRSVSRHKMLASNNLSLVNNSSSSDEGNCVHRRHVKLEFLHDLNLSENQIEDLILTTANASNPTDIGQQRSFLLYPALTRLNVAQNQLVSIPTSISLFENLSTLILRDNRRLREIPLSIGSMQKLWNLDLQGCGRAAQ